MLAAAPVRASLPVRVITVYHAVEAQTDASPLVTADGSRITPEVIEHGRYCAVSQELLWFKGGALHFGDTIRVEGIGELSGSWIVHDTMWAGVTGYVDLLVPLGTMGVWTEGVEVSHEPYTGR